MALISFLFLQILLKLASYFVLVFWKLGNLSSCKLSSPVLPGQNRLVDIVNNRLDDLARTRRWDAPVLSNRCSKIELDKLQNNFVITVVDKAAGNFALTCKKFHFLRLAKELGLDNQQPGNETYRFVDRTEQEICQDLVSKLEPLLAKGFWEEGGDALS